MKMNEEIEKLKIYVYEIEASLAHQQFMLEIIKDFGEYNSENSDGVDKMTYMINILHNHQKALRKKFDDFIPKFQKSVRR